MAEKLSFSSLGMLRELLPQTEVYYKMTVGQLPTVAALAPPFLAASDRQFIGHPLVSPLLGSVWKIKILAGSAVQSPDEVLVILEAMKTEIPLTAGQRLVGRRLSALGRGIQEGATVSPGDVLMIFE